MRSRLVCSVSNTVPPPGPPPEPDELLLEAMREVDALFPGTPPIAPRPSPTWRREEWLASLAPPDAPAAGVYPRRPAPPPLPTPTTDIFEKVTKW